METSGEGLELGSLAVIMIKAVVLPLDAENEHKAPIMHVELKALTRLGVVSDNASRHSARLERKISGQAGSSSVGGHAGRQACLVVVGGEIRLLL